MTRTARWGLVALGLLMTAPARADKGALLPLRRGGDFSGDRSWSGAARVRRAWKEKRAVVVQLMKAAGLHWPPRRVLLRAYKKEKELEVWAASERRGRLVPVARYAICADSGGLGPKKAEGDGQVPEGFYKTTIFMPKTAYWMGMHIDYPNGRDRQLKRTGSAIMIHGSCASIGCLAMTDERIQEIWLFTRGLRPRRAVPVHIYPARDMKALIAKTKDAKLKAFWQNLAHGRAFVDQNGRVPRIGWTKTGVYTFR